MNWIEAIAAIAGVLCVWLLIRQSIWNFAFGIIQVSLSVYVFYFARLYSDLILHVFYIVLNVYGWVHWSRGSRRGDSPLPVTRLTRLARTTWGIATLILTAAWGTFMAMNTDAAAPYVDAFTMMASMVAQWLTARKKLESWWLWIVVDLVAIPLFAWRGLYFFAALYVVFLVLCFRGLREWRQSTFTPARSTVAAGPLPAGTRPGTA